MRTHPILTAQRLGYSELSEVTGIRWRIDRDGMIPYLPRSHELIPSTWSAERPYAEPEVYSESVCQGCGVDPVRWRAMPEPSAIPLTADYFRPFPVFLVSFSIRGAAPLALLAPRWVFGLTRHLSPLGLSLSVRPFEGSGWQTTGPMRREIAVPLARMSAQGRSALATIEALGGWPALSAALDDIRASRRYVRAGLSPTPGLAHP